MQILWLKTELLHPVDKGGKIRTYQMLKALKRDHHITYLTLDDGSASPNAVDLASEYCHEVLTVPHVNAPKFSVRFYAELAGNLLSPLPYAVQKYRSRGMRSEIQRLARPGAFDVVVSDFLVPAVNVPEGLPCPLVLFQHNVEAVIWRRHFEIAANPVKKAYLRSQWQRMARFEGRVCRSVDAVITVSPEDTRTIESDYGASPVDDVPTGVDVEYFRPSRDVAREPGSIVFTGSMDWLPNDDAIRFFVEHVLPRVRRVVPHATLTIVGRNPLPWMLELARRDPSVIVTGRVEDVRPYLERASAYVVPIRIGGGTRLKIYEGMAMGCPMVSTRVGAEGLPLEDGREILLADDARAFSEAVVRLLTDEVYARELARRAAGRVREEFAWDRVASRFAELCERAVAGAGARRIA